MTLALQASLLDVATGPELGRLAETVRRTDLGLGAWVDVRPGWVSGSDALFDRLLDEVAWQAERRHMYEHAVDVPRLLCFYGEDGAARPGADRGARPAQPATTPASWASRS